MRSLFPREQSSPVLFTADWERHSTRNLLSNQIPGPCAPRLHQCIRCTRRGTANLTGSWPAGCQLPCVRRRYHRQTCAHVTHAVGWGQSVCFIPATDKPTSAAQQIWRVREEFGVVSFRDCRISRFALVGLPPWLDCATLDNCLHLASRSYPDVISGSFLVPSAARTSRSLVGQLDSQHQIISIIKSDQKGTNAFNPPLCVASSFLSVTQCHLSKETLSKPLVPPCCACASCIINRHESFRSTTFFFWRHPYNVAFMNFPSRERDAYLAPCRLAMATLTSRRWYARKAQTSSGSVKSSDCGQQKGRLWFVLLATGRVYVEKRWRTAHHAPYSSPRMGTN
jgi:hypothetical protein